ncbi:MAG: hypothetical protein LDL39_06065 [Magnetospirillum sp.]|nr:hypothetical protein [Magnetospirillum sp.]
MSYTDVKPWYLSRTIIGAVIAMIAAALKNFGIALDDTAQQDLINLVLTGAELGGGALAIYGRVAASTVIKPSGGGGAVAGAFLLIAVLSVAGPSACASRVAETPAQTVYALKGDFAAVLPAVRAYVQSDQANPAVKKHLQSLTLATDEALDAAETAVKKGDDPMIPAAIAAGQRAVQGLLSYLKQEGIL